MDVTGFDWKVPSYVQRPLQMKSCMFLDGEGYYLKVLETENDKERALQLWKQDFENDPTMAGFNFDTESKNSLEMLIWKCLNQNIAHGCFTKSEDELIAVDLQHVRKNYIYVPDRSNHKGEAFKKYLEYLKIFGAYAGLHHTTGAMKFLTSFGVFIDSSHRRHDLDIHAQMLKIRVRVSKNLRLKATVSAFVGSKMQSLTSLAQKIGYKDHPVLYYKNLHSLIPNSEIPIKLMEIVKKSKNEIDKRRIVKPRGRRNQPAGIHNIPSKALIEETAMEDDEE